MIAAIIDVRPLELIGQKIGDLGDVYLAGDFSLDGLQRIANISASICDDCLAAANAIIGEH